MANTEHLEILKSGVDQWNKWRQEHPEIRPELSKADLSGMNLSDVNFSDADLSSSNLSKVNLSRAQFIRANLSSSNLSEARMDDMDNGEEEIGVGADLSYANLSYSTLNRARMIKVTFLNANLSNARLHDTDCSICDFEGVDFSDAHLIYCNFLGADFTSANLKEADLMGSTFNGANFGNTNFKESRMSGTIFGFAKFTKCLGLETVEVENDCVIDFKTVQMSTGMPKSFLIKLGLPDLLIDYLPDFYIDSINLFPTFLSHNKEDKEFARKLYNALSKRGVRVFFDEKQLKPGDSLVKSIKNGINHYDKTILVCSQASLSSKWVDYELELVLKKEQNLMNEKVTDDLGLLIPITIDDHIFERKGSKEDDIKNRFIGDFREWQDDVKFDGALNELIQALNINRKEIKPPSFL